MKKKIYAVRKGRVPGIYDVWSETEQQVKGFKGAEYRSFTYMTEKESEDETVEMSRSYAMKQAVEYLERILDESDREEGVLEKYDEKAVLKKELEDYLNREILEKAGLEYDSHTNSLWIEALLKHISSADKEHQPNINGNYYTGRYSCTSLYTALLYLILDDDKILYFYQRKCQERQDELPGFETEDINIQELWHESEDYNLLRKRFEGYGMEAVDLPEIFKRNVLKARGDLETGSFLKIESKSYMAMKRFIKQGGHTIMGLYRELVGNPVYRQDLLELSGPFRNPDLETEYPAEETEKSKASMRDIVMRASAISIALKEKVVGQNDVIDKIENSFFNAEKETNAGNKKKGPRQAYLFAGPPGVGKTFIAEIIANTLGIPHKRFDMSGYSDRGTVTELMGSSTLYKDSKPGVLTNFVRENPRCVLLFDEVEKACNEAILLFLQILDEGKCFDRHYDKDIDFRNTIVILTTNAGKQLYQNAENENLTLLPDSVVIDALKKDIAPASNTPFFPPELVSRMSSHTTIMFNHLRADSILKIIKADLDKQLKLLKERYGYDIESEKDKLAATALFSMGGNMDARNAAVLAGKIIDKGLYDFLVRAEEKMGLNWRERIRKISWEHDFFETSDEIRQFYLGEKNCVIAIFGNEEEIHNDRLAESDVQIRITDDPEEFMQIISKENIILAIVDYAYGMKEKGGSLSITDIKTEGGRVFDDIRKEYGEIPVFILYEDGEYSYGQSEKRKIYSRGAQGFLNRKAIATEITAAYADICCQKTMETLSLRHQRLTYEIRNEQDEKKKFGKIVFCNFKLESSVEAEDKDLLLSADTRPNKHWDDIFVADNVKKELQYFIDFLKKPKEYLQKGVRVPKGVLMFGPAGTGKTSIAKVVATESGVSFLEIGADVLANKGADEVRRVFRTARKYAPAVLFIDEVDAIGKDRQLTPNSVTLNALLTEMDGFKKVDDKPVFVMAATNLGNQIDRALSRRFDRTLFIDIPDRKGREWMLERLICKHQHMFDISDEKIGSIVHRLDGRSFADIENLIEAALREAIRSDKPADDILLDEILENLKYGEVRETGSLEAVKRTAYHEAGHALIPLYHNRVPEYMSIVARGGHNGYMLSDSSRESVTKESLLEQICEALGGRAAEMVYGYGLTAGASSDLKQATTYASWMVCELGMYEKEVGLAVISKDQLHFNEKAVNLINQILSEQLQEAIRIINEKKDALERLAEAVLNSEKKYLTRREIEAAYIGLD